MYAVITLDNDGQPTEHATASTYSVALRKANDLINSPEERTTATIAYKHACHYQRLITLTYERNPAPIRHDGPDEEYSADYTTSRFVYGRSLTFKASHKAVYVDVYQHGKAIDTISAYDYKADKSKLDNPKAFHEVVDLYTVRVAPNYMDTIAY